MDEKLNRKYKNLEKALKTFKKALVSFSIISKNEDNHNSKFSYQDEYKTYRDSLIQRFEYSIDLFWKYLKIYLETKLLLKDIKIPSNVIRESFANELINASQAEQILEMLKARNITSHIYFEEIAEQLAKEMDNYYKTMHEVSIKILP